MKNIFTLFTKGSKNGSTARNFHNSNGGYDVSTALFKSKNSGEYKSYIQNPGKPIWSKRDYEKFSTEGYVKNVIVNRCIAILAKNAASVPFLLHKMEKDGGMTPLPNHQLLTLLDKPNPTTNGIDFFEALYTYKLISGNSFINAIGGNITASGITANSSSANSDADSHLHAPTELYILRPDMVEVTPGKNGIPSGYIYTSGKSKRNFPVDNLTGRSAILHLKNFHPLNSWYGLSSMEAAAYSIDQHNESAKWNQALLQNGARPSGALIVKSKDENDILTDEQFTRLKEQLDSDYKGAINAGKPILLEGGLEWKEMSLSPRDMDFLNIKHSSARDIALSFGVPPQMLGIPGDNTYSNMSQARLALWEQTILPMMDNVISALNGWLTPMFGGDLVLSYNKDSISALTARRDMVWERLKDADFLSDEEKREMLGLGRLDDVA